MNAKTETQSFSIEWDLPHAPKKVWRALTEPALLAKWLMSTDMQLALGTSFTFQAPSSPQWDGKVNCTMQEIEPQKRLRYSWAGGGLEGTVVTWTLTATSTGGTLLRLEHAGFKAGQKEARFFEGAKQGWQFMGGKRLIDVLSEMTVLSEIQSEESA